MCWSLCLNLAPVFEFKVICVSLCLNSKKQSRKQHVLEPVFEFGACSKPNPITIWLAMNDEDCQVQGEQDC